MYQIQEDGYVFLPLLGPVSAANKSYDQLQADLERAFTTQMEGHIKVSIQLIDREPIYVIGPVTRPGTFKYVPGMTVGHVLALAGGLEGTSDLWRVLDLGREQERINKASERLMRLLAISEVLTAEAARRKPVPSQQLLDLAGRARGQQLVDGEERFRALKRQKLNEQESAIAALIAANENELRILREKLTQVEVRIKEKAERATAMAVLRTKGTTTDTSFYFAQSEAGDALERWHEVRTAIAQAERKTVELQQERQKLAIDAAVSREEELKQASIASAEEAVTIKVLGNLLATMPIAKTYAGDRRLNFKIIRRTPTGVQELSAKGVQSLEPGDLLQVTPIEVEATASRAGILAAARYAVRTFESALFREGALTLALHREV